MNLFNKEQITLLRSLGLNFDYEHMTAQNITDEEYFTTEDTVGDYYTSLAQATDEVTHEERLCGEIIDILTTKVE